MQYVLSELTIFRLDAALKFLLNGYHSNNVICILKEKKNECLWIKLILIHVFFGFCSVYHLYFSYEIYLQILVPINFTHAAPSWKEKYSLLISKNSFSPFFFFFLIIIIIIIIIVIWKKLRKKLEKAHHSSYDLEKTVKMSSIFLITLACVQEEESIRKNRLALLKKIADLPRGIADLSVLPGF